MVSGEAPLHTLSANFVSLWNMATQEKDIGERTSQTAAELLPADTPSKEKRDMRLVAAS